MLLAVRNTRPKVPLFILGSQRSGTTMTADVFTRSPACEVFLGDKRRLVFEGPSRLVPIAEVGKLVNASRRRIVVFKPNNDLQRAHEFLDFSPHSRILWIYRDYRDAINSSIQRWGAAHRDIMLGICKGTILHPGQAAIAEGVGRELRVLLESLCHDEMSAADGAALLWYARNSLYFDLQLEKNARVMLVNYEDTVRDPEANFARMFKFADARFKPRYVSGVFRSSIGKRRQPELGAGVETLCRSMMARLDMSITTTAAAADQARA